MGNRDRIHYRRIWKSANLHRTGYRVTGNVFRFIFAASMLGVTSAAAAQDALPEWVAADTAEKTVHLILDASPGGPEGIAVIDGYHHGGVQIVVPLNWTVSWSWTNHDTSAVHSLVVMAEREKLPLEGGRPALDNALSRAELTGLKAGQHDNTSFVADQAGWYWMLCGVPGHALRGEWIGFKIDRDALLPTVIRKM